MYRNETPNKHFMLGGGEEDKHYPWFIVTVHQRLKMFKILDTLKYLLVGHFGYFVDVSVRFPSGRISFSVRCFNRENLIFKIAFSGGEVQSPIVCDTVSQMAIRTGSHQCS